MNSLNIPNDFLQIKDEDYHKVIARFNMTDRMVQESLDTIRDWYKMQRHLPEGALTDDRLFRHLLAVGFRLEKAKEKIDNLLTARNIIPELMTNRDPGAPWALAYRKYVTVAIIPQRLDDMTRIMICNFNDVDANDFNMWDHFKFWFMLCDYRLCSDIAAGDHYIVDFKGIKLAHVVKFTPTMIKKVVFIIQSCFGAKVKGIHYTNVPAYAETMVNLLKAGLSKKLAGRVFTYQGYEGLHQNIPKSVLPAELGGTNKTMLEYQEDTMKEICKPEWREWFRNQDQYVTDESRRLGFTNDMSNELLGIHGSFRRLDLD